MSANPGSDIRIHLAAAGIGLTAGTNLFDGPEVGQGTGVPHEACFVLSYGGAPTIAHMGKGYEERYPMVQVRVRSGVDDYAGGEALSRAVLHAIHHRAVARSIGGYYTDVTVQQSEPLYIGHDNDRCHRWSINVELWHREDRST